MHLVSCANAARAARSRAANGAAGGSRGRRALGWLLVGGLLCVAVHAARRRGRVVQVGGRRASSRRIPPELVRRRATARRRRARSRVGCCRRAIAEWPTHARWERAAVDAMIRTFSCAGFGQAARAGRFELDGSPRCLVQPIEARIESRVTAGGVAGQREVAVQARTRRAPVRRARGRAAARSRPR